MHLLYLVPILGPSLLLKAPLVGCRYRSDWAWLFHRITLTLWLAIDGRVRVYWNGDRRGNIVAALCESLETCGWVTTGDVDDLLSIHHSWLSVLRVEHLCATALGIRHFPITSQTRQSPLVQYFSPEGGSSAHCGIHGIPITRRQNIVPTTSRKHRTGERNIIAFSVSSTRPH